MKDCEYYKSLLDKCWEARQYYKDEQNKLLYWIGTVFAAIAGATGILGAIRRTNTVFSFTIYHILIFHMLFLITWLYYLYKKLNSDIYHHIGLAINEYIKKQSEMDDIFPSFFDIKGHYLGPDNKFLSGRHLSNFANLLILILYLSLVTAPIWKGSIDPSGVSITWPPVISLIIFVGLAVIGQGLYLKARKRLLEDIDNAKKSLLSKIVSK